MWKMLRPSFMLSVATQTCLVTPGFLKVPLPGALINPHDSNAPLSFLVWFHQADVVGRRRFWGSVWCPSLHDGLSVLLFLAVPPSRREALAEPHFDRVASRTDGLELQLAADLLRGASGCRSQDHAKTQRSDAGAKEHG